MTGQDYSNMNNQGPPPNQGPPNQGPPPNYPTQNNPNEFSGALPNYPSMDQNPPYNQPANNQPPQNQYNQPPQTNYNQQGPPPTNFNQQGPIQNNFNPQGGPPVNNYNPQGPPQANFPPGQPPQMHCNPNPGYAQQNQMGGPQPQQGQQYQQVPGMGPPPQIRPPQSQIPIQVNVTTGPPPFQQPIIMNPAPVMQIKTVYHFDKDAMHITCPHCRFTGNTRMERTMDSGMICLVVLCFLFIWSIIGLILLCILCANANNYEIRHYCQNCNRHVGTRER